MKECLDRIGICFLFAPALHKAMKYAIGPRREMGIRTIFNILGPLTNPSYAPTQLLGVFDPALTETLGSVLKNLGTKHAFVVHGMDRIDEISLSAETQITEVTEKDIATTTISPEAFGISRCDIDEIKGGTPEDNAAIMNELLGGTKNAYRDIVVLNAAFALTAAGIAPTPQEGIKRACESIDSGAAAEKLQKLIALTGEG
jgi:anthranilate phosphoribosyltransferase